LELETFDPTTEILIRLMKTLILIAISVFAAVPFTFANDGVFYAQGSNLIPLQETRVQLRKEVLKFFVRDYRFADIDVDFEFYNPDGERSLTVGFVSPPAFGDVGEEEQEHPRISNFTVMVNGEKLEFKIAKMEQTSFNAEALDVNGFDFVYYFDVKFKPGINRVRHTYRFEGGGSVETFRDFYYQITTGKRWANKEIGDFELQLHMDEGIFNLPARFVKGGKLADWRIVGDGAIKPKAEKMYDFDDDSIRMAHLNRGYFLFKAKSFRPDFDIAISEFNWGTGWIRKMCKAGTKCLPEDAAERYGLYMSREVGDYVEISALKELTAKELKMLRNFAFALRGYDFRDKDLKSYFTKFFWYKPEPSLKAEDIGLSDAEKVFIEKVRAAESSK
jgi:hypothetical protein